MAIPKWMNDYFDTQTGSIPTPSNPVPKEPIVSTKLKNDWADLGLMELTERVNEMANYFKSQGRNSPRMEDVVRFCELGFSPNNAEVSSYLNGTLSLKEIEILLEKKPIVNDLTGTLTEQCRLEGERQRMESYKREQASKEWANQGAIMNDTKDNWLIRSIMVASVLVAID